MKQQQAPKWLLTTALLAVLGANYGFQSSSLSLHKENGLFELSSETSGGTRGSGQGGRSSAAPAPTVTTNAPPAASSATTVSHTAAVSEPAALPRAGQAKDNTGKEVQFIREGKVLATGTCADGTCKSVVLDMSTLEKFAANLVSATSKVAPTTQVAAATGTQVVAKPEVESDYDCDFSDDGKAETRAQKRDRLRCEKQEKERTKSEDRIAKFEDKMESIKDRCEVSSSESKLECLSREFNSATSRFSGRNAIPANVVQRYFKNVVGSELSKMLFNSDVDPKTAMSMLQDVFDGLPSEYGVIRQNILSAIQTETKTRSQAINQQYKLAETLKNKPQEYLQTVGEAQAAQAELGQMVEVYSAAARTSDSFSADTSFARYYQTNYMPSMKSLFASMGPQGTTGTTTTDADKVENKTRGNTRGSTATTGTSNSIPNVTGGTRGAATTSTKVDGQNPSQWEFLGNAAGVRVGAPSNTSIGNTRGGRSMGQ
ncbi:hypothetical protein CIK05_13770 [Bdellovibrio sp. qaytius]|nr:hypothetical protein CIK05_13770 [Bdellovibrio sp. qaytius]